MEKCLVSKLKAAVADSSLPIFGEIKITFKSSSTVSSKGGLAVAGWSHVRVIGDGYILDSNYENPVKEKDITDEDYGLYFSPGTYTIALRADNNVGPFSLRCFGASKPTDVSFDLDDINGVDIEYLGLLNVSDNMSGSIDGLSIRKLIQFVGPKEANVYGSVDNIILKSPSALEGVELETLYINGSIESFKDCYNLQYLQLKWTSCTGELNTLIQGMCDKGRHNGTLLYVASGASTYEGVLFNASPEVTITFLSTTSYTVSFNGNTDTWTKSGGTWSKS